MSQHHEVSATQPSGTAGTPLSEIAQNVVVGLTVSFVALSLGAALGILSGRGAFAGMISAGIIAVITAALGGTRVQCSGPTAPMSAVSATVVAFAVDRAASGALPMPAAHFINLVFLLCGVLLLVGAAFRLGRFIALVPNVVVSGFMNGIALLIWMDQIGMLFGLGTRSALSGPIGQNLVVALGTLLLIFLLAPVTRRLVGPVARFLPSTLVAIIVMTALSAMMGWSIERVSLSGSLANFSELGDLFRAQIPAKIPSGAVTAALPFALQLALLCYLDTLLTSLVVDKMSGERSRQNRELMAQGLANGTIAFVGGIPGAQATIRSVLMLKEKATLRIAGIMVGAFVLLEIVLFQDLINRIPKAVFVGVLIKVGYDVFDVRPVRIYLSEILRFRTSLFHDFLARHDEERVFVTNREILMIAGTALMTLLYDLNMAVGGFTLLFYLHNRVLNQKNPMRDLRPLEETDGFATEN